VPLAIPCGTSEPLAFALSPPFEQSKLCRQRTETDKARTCGARQYALFTYLSFTYQLIYIYYYYSTRCYMPFGLLLITFSCSMLMLSPMLK